MMEFHVSRLSRDRYQFDQSLFSFNGNVILANFHAARIFAQKINQKKDLINFPEQAIKAGQLNAMGLIDEILHFVIALYRKQKNPKVMQQALDDLNLWLGSKDVERTLKRFVTDFPPVAVYQGELSVDDYLEEKSEDGTSNRALVLEELILLWVTNRNPAVEPYQEFFDDSTLNSETAYARIFARLHVFLDTQPTFGPDQQNLLDLLRAPALAVPHSLTGQLEFIRSKWSELLGKFLYRLLSSLDFIKEEEKLYFTGPGPVAIPVYDREALLGLSSAELEPERFSLDREWMPRLVLIAKNTYVWLDQLSKKYQRQITRLDQIPTEELAALANMGFTGLWLIGLWQRSIASARVKQLCGNPEAISSAYSLDAYRIADDLGGEDSYRVLRDKAWQYGIRLASDMVPNHMAIDSEWVADHPDWFVSLDYPPFPSYSFNGPDLSKDGRQQIFLEDHYYSRTDASVVFKRVDKWSGETRYIYHGNDGTSMPWNDTAQLNYLKPEVREAVIQTILDVARKFPIIRFDAAMTLAKKHYQRLWFPEPGSGGDIPSRAEYGLTRADFDRLMPIEFWREVVDRCAVEAPDTLLLAEAFWLMEGYFVRTLGMHRVYNSAFMNILRNEENAKYRLIMKNTLEFEPEIMKRFVNFMNNPDERTAVDQFGKGDKYFGICTMMATLPGLPMFGHGQIEGFSEKYGMEFRRAYWDEAVDHYLVARHEREISPLLHKRAMFANVDNFLLYDFFTPEGQVNEDVFAYSNGLGSEHALVIYHNKFGSTRGWVRVSVGQAVKSEGETKIVQRSLSEGLGLDPAPNKYVVFKDHNSGLEFIRPSLDIAQNGFYVELEAYKTHVFLNFREIQDDVYSSYKQLCEFLNGRGVPNVEEALKELILRPVLTPFNEIANPGYFLYLLNNKPSEETPKLSETLLAEARQKISHLMDGVEYMTGLKAWDKNALLEEQDILLETILALPVLGSALSIPEIFISNKAQEFIKEGLQDHEERRLILLGWLFVHKLGTAAAQEGYAYQTISWLDEWQFGKILVKTYQSLGKDEATARQMVATIRFLISQQNWFTALGLKPVDQILKTWLADSEIQRFIGMNRHNDIIWYNKEAFEDFLWWMTILANLEGYSNLEATATDIIERDAFAYEIILTLAEADKQSGYQVEKLLNAVQPPAVPTSQTAAPKADDKPSKPLV
jgi:hypothetical protein